MFKIVVKREGVSNLPAYVFDGYTAPSEIEEALEEIALRPNEYRFEIVGNFVWNEFDTEMYISFVKPLVRIAAGDDGTIPILFGCIQTNAVKHD